MMKFENYMTLEFPSRSNNEAFARSAVACFAAQLDPTMEELGDIRTAVSEAIHGCKNSGMLTVAFTVFIKLCYILRLRAKIECKVI